MRRWATNLLCLFSLLIFAASVAIWVRSYFVRDVAEWSYEATPGDWRGIELQSSRGTATLNAVRTRFARFFFEPRVGWSFTHERPAPSLSQRFAGSGRVHFSYGGIQILSGGASAANMSNTWRCIAFPLWLFLPFAIPPMLWLRRRRKSRGRGFPVSSEKKLNHPSLSTAAGDAGSTENGAG